MRKLMPLGANIDELAAHMTLDKPELAATLAHLEAYDIVEIASAGFGGAVCPNRTRALSGKRRTFMK